jgi:hypothetical protein
VSSVVIYTNALANPDMSWHTSTGVVDWPHFIARVLSHLSGDLTLIDVVLSRPPHLAHIAYPKKNFARVTEALAAAGRPVGDDERIFFFDDKPGEILGASERFVAWHAPEYKAPLTLEQIDAMLVRLIMVDSVCRWAQYTPAVIRSQIHTMSTQCKDALILVPLVAPGAWCGFDLDAHLPLPPPPAPPARVIIESETTEDIDTVPASPVPPPSVRHRRHKSRRLRLHIELTLNISVGRRHKKKWSATASPVHVSPQLYRHLKHEGKY